MTMYIAITPQHMDINYKGSVRDFVNYLEKENMDRDESHQECFFDQDHDRVDPETVIRDIDANTAKLKKTDPKFYSLVVSPSPRELRHIDNDPAKLRRYVRALMVDYAKAFYRDEKVTVNDILYYAKIERGRTFKGWDRQVRDNQPYATKILQLSNDIRRIRQGRLTGNIKALENEIARLEREAPHQQQGKRIVRGMPKEGFQSHVHIIVSRKDRSNTRSLSPGSKYKKSITVLNGKEVKQGFHREAFFKAAERTFDKTFGYGRNFVESYRAKTLFLKDPKAFFTVLVGLPTTERQLAFRLLRGSGVAIPFVPVNSAQWALKAFMKLKKGMDRALRSGSIGI